jgi:hypothetical protein
MLSVLGGEAGVGQRILPWAIVEKFIVGPMVGDGGVNAPSCYHQPLVIFDEHLGDTADREDVADPGHSQAA